MTCLRDLPGAAPLTFSAVISSSAPHDLEVPAAPRGFAGGAGRALEGDTAPPPLLSPRVVASDLAEASYSQPQSDPPQPAIAAPLPPP